MNVNARTFLFLPLLAALALFLQACVLWPHTREELPAIRGQVVDANTLRPVPGALISIHDHPKTTAISDAAGRFRFREQESFYLGYTIGMCWGDWPDRGEWTTVLDVTHPDYEPFEDYVEPDPSASTEGHEWTLREIRLKPK